jgi:hypothetical protein
MRARLIKKADIEAIETERTNTTGSDKEGDECRRLGKGASGVATTG